MSVGFALPKFDLILGYFQSINGAHMCVIVSSTKYVIMKYLSIRCYQLSYANAGVPRGYIKSHLCHLSVDDVTTVYPKKYAHGFCFAVLCCGYTLTDFPISIRLTSLALWQSNDCPSASKATLMNMDKYFM